MVKEKSKIYFSWMSSWYLRFDFIFEGACIQVMLKCNLCCRAGSLENILLLFRYQIHTTCIWVKINFSETTDCITYCVGAFTLLSIINVFLFPVFYYMYYTCAFVVKWRYVGRCSFLVRWMFSPLLLLFGSFHFINL